MSPARDTIRTTIETRLRELGFCADPAMEGLWWLGRHSVSFGSYAIEMSRRDDWIATFTYGTPEAVWRAALEELAR